MLYKANSKIDGMGIFTDSPIKAGQAFYDIPIKTTSNVPKPRWARAGVVWVSDNQVLDYLNHSCQPNSRLDISRHCLVSLRDIAVGEELTSDYNKTETDGSEVPCHCGASSCRGYFLREELS